MLHAARKNMPWVTTRKLEIHIDGELWKEEVLYDDQFERFKQHVEEFGFGYPDEEY